MRKKKKKKLKEEQEKKIWMLVTSGFIGGEIVEFQNKSKKLHFKFDYKKREVKIILHKKGKKKYCTIPLDFFQILAEYVPRTELNISEDYLN